MNHASSRSHSVFTCIIESKVSKFLEYMNSAFIVLFTLFATCYIGLRKYFSCQWESQGVTHHRFAQLNLVDLAGSER